MQKYTSVNQFLNDLPEAKRTQVDALRALITNTLPTAVEHIKWNAPSYVIDGEDRITFNILNKEGLVKLVLHMGALRKEDGKAAPVYTDTSSLITWVSDIRGYITITDTAMIADNKQSLQKILKDWVAIR